MSASEPRRGNAAPALNPGDGHDSARRLSRTRFGLYFELRQVHNIANFFLRLRPSATKPGGRVAVLEFVPNEDRISPPVAAAFSLAMLASTPSGDAYTFSELETMLHAAGFANVTQRPVPMGPHTVVMGSA